MSKTEPKNPWRIAIGYCLQCWWKQTEEFHHTVETDSIRKNLDKKHKETNCSAHLRYEFKVKKT